jgi:hypothetical protein
VGDAADFNELYVARTRQPDPPSNEMVLGSITHCLIAGTPIEEEFLVGTDCNSRRGKAWNDVLAEAEEKRLQPILPDQLETAELMAASVRRHPIAGQLFEAKGLVEHSIRWIDPGTSLKLKCRTDHLIPAPPCWTVIDLKSSATPWPDAFLYVAYRKYYYQIQAAVYLRGVRHCAHVDPAAPVDFIFAVVGNKPPFDVWCYQMDGAEQAKADRELAAILDRLVQSYATGEWTAPGQNSLNAFKPPFGGDDFDLEINGETVSL